MGVQFEFREFPNVQLVLNALERGEIDVIPSLVVGERFEPVMDFSQSYMKSGLSIAVPAESGGYRWARIFQGFFSEQILKAVGFMLLVSFAAGIIVWAFERRRNSEMFGGGHDRGDRSRHLVGDGDNVHRRLWRQSAENNRWTNVALVWMIFSIVFIASFTANITTSLTLDELKGKVRGFNDLHHARVGVNSRLRRLRIFIQTRNSRNSLSNLSGRLAGGCQQKHRCVCSR